MGTRTRLSPEDRREQLLDLGSRLFASRPYEDVWIEEVAEQAGVSRGLLYHYFPTKRAFFAAMLRRESARMMELTEPDASLGITEQLRAGVDAYLGYCQEHAHGVRMIYNGAGSSDPEVQEIIESGLAGQEARIICVMSPDNEAHCLLRIAVRSWLMFMRAASYGWLESPGARRQDIRDMCVNNLIATILALPDSARPPILPALPG